MVGGGLDSSALFALAVEEARRVDGRRVSGLTMSFAGPGDDRPHMASLLAHLDARTLSVRPEDIGALDARFFRVDAAPYVSPTAPPQRVLYERARAWGAHAILTGLQGDLVLDGDVEGFAERLTRGDARALLEVARLRVPWTSSPMRRVVEYVVKPLLRPRAPRAWVERRRLAWLRSLDVWRWAGPRLRSLLPHLWDARRTERLHEDMWTSFATSAEATEWADGYGQEEAAAGLPVIPIYDDPRLIELIASLPPEQLFFGGESRGLFRLALKGLIPEPLRTRQDKASMEPLLEGMVRSMSRSGAFTDLLTMRAAADLGLVEPRPFRAIFDDLVRGKAHARNWLLQWAMLAVEGFLRTVDAPNALAGAA
jgi:asparagine synthase (glutamine-hydrolysing)